MPSLTIFVVPDAELTQLDVELDHIAGVVDAGFAPLTPKERKAIVKVTPKRGAVMASIASLATQYGVDSPSHPLAKTKVRIEAAAKLAPVVAKFEAVYKRFLDLLATAEGDGWTGSSALYAILTSEARTNPVLKAALVTVRQTLRTTPVQPQEVIDARKLEQRRKAKLRRDNKKAALIAASKPAGVPPK